MPWVAAAHHGTDKSKRYGDRSVASECRFSSGERTRTMGRNLPVLPGSNQTSEGKAPGLLGLAQKGRQPPSLASECRFSSGERTRTTGRNPPVLPGSNQTSEGKAPGLLGLAQKGRQPPLPVGRKGRLSQSRQPSGGEEPPCLNTGARPARRGPP
ncbi:UNVERIFIED_CONTAM: hypothetical protein FKN15_061929 [Acipenser sinensis]